MKVDAPVAKEALAVNLPIHEVPWQFPAMVLTGKAVEMVFAFSAIRVSFKMAMALQLGLYLAALS